MEISNMKKVTKMTKVFKWLGCDKVLTKAKNTFYSRACASKYGTVLSRGEISSDSIPPTKEELYTRTSQRMIHSIPVCKRA